MLYFIVNEKSKSGNAKQIWKDIEEVLKVRNVSYQVFVSEYRGHAGKLAGEICAMDDDDICLVAVGGDGTANEVINGITDFEKVRFGVIPTGSGNDLARGLALSKDPKNGIVHILNAMKKTREDTWCMDLGEVIFGDEKRLFAISSGIGLDALVCKKALKSTIKDILNKIRLGKLTYLVLTVQSLFTMQTADMEIVFDKEESIQKKRMIFIAAMNFKAEGGGVPMAPAASACDGKLSFCEAAGIPKWRTFLCLPFLVAAKHTSIHGFSVTDAKDCTIHLNRPMVVHADGEYCGEVAEVHFRCLPGKLCVLK